MKFTGERYMPALSGEIACEHMNRYYFVTNQFDLTGKVVLDIASGEGYGTNILAKYAAYVYGVDISEETVEHARKTYKKDNLTFKTGDAIAIPLDDASVDLAISFETIEHLEEHQRMMDELKRVLKKDGVLIISSPDKLHYSDLNNYDNHFHVKELYHEEFKALINQNFKHASFFSQKVFVGSMLIAADTHMNHTEPLLIDKEGVRASLDPRFHLAVCTDGEKVNLTHSIVSYSEVDRIIVPQELINASYAGQLVVNNSLSYKIGSLLVNPMRKIKTLANSLLTLL